MQNIRIKRIKNGSKSETIIETADDSWMLHVDTDGHPHLFIGVDVPADENDELGEGDVMRGFIPAELYNWPPGVPLPEHLVELCGTPETATTQTETGASLTQ
jgi:hypothetical protein